MLFAGRDKTNIHWGWYILALSIVAIWATTFVSTKLLLKAGLAPQDIFLYRFLMAYVGIWFFGRGRLFAHSWGDEAKLAVLGATGGSLYFMAENTALQYTLASNVALLLSTAPIMTAITAHFFARSERITRNLAIGSALAFGGVALVVFNGEFILSMSPAGDILSIAAALSWAIYTLVLKGLSGKYPAIFITRKVFFYGILTVLPVFIFHPLHFDPAIMVQPVVWSNLLFLGVVASLLCFLFWNRVVARMGAVRTTNYVYFAPPITLIASHIILGEPITYVALAGAALIIFGVFTADRSLRKLL